ncbi:hypothetical protein PAXRUDRAFT_790717 [Paxillus rubicundulus Ve08.2h10]|uniref:Uncharacterized protein n=1 Tax=Paxillus rubicundulus Ve08.2h10 TaxID=930991 RepID=A0A0D0CGI8_9AGAM|nr:hypothetical protein PAXRUDRAFT_790717 [Paxillus rubicundulus Ve08.2h10]
MSRRRWSISCWVLVQFSIIIVTLMVTLLVCGGPSCTRTFDNQRRLTRHRQSCSSYQKTTLLAMQKRQERAKNAEVVTHQKVTRQLLTTGNTMIPAGPNQSGAHTLRGLRGVVSASMIQNSVGNGHCVDLSTSEPPSDILQFLPSLDIRRVLPSDPGVVVAEASGIPVLPQSIPPTYDEDDSNLNMEVEGINSDVSGIWSDGDAPNPGVQVPSHHARTSCSLSHSCRTLGSEPTASSSATRPGAICRVILHVRGSLRTAVDYFGMCR